MLADKGIDAVGVEPLARRLNVTKGSFYWHFKDRAALLDAMLDDWRRRATLHVIERIDHSGGSPLDRLRQLFKLPLTGSASRHGARVEQAIRFWARSDARAAAAIAEVDALRLSYIASQLRSGGVRPAEVEARAFLLYAYIQAEATLPNPQLKVRQACERLLLG